MIYKINQIKNTILLLEKNYLSKKNKTVLSMQQKDTKYFWNWCWMTREKKSKAAFAVPFA